MGYVKHPHIFDSTSINVMCEMILDLETNQTIADRLKVPLRTFKRYKSKILMANKELKEKLSWT